MKKLIAGLISATMLITMFSMHVIAEENQISYYQNDSGNLKVFIDLGNDAYGHVMLTVFDKDNFDATTFGELSDEEKASLIEYSKVGQLSNGSAEFEVSIDGETGLYPYMISEQYTGEVISGNTFAYIATESDVLSNISNKSSAEIESYLDTNAALVFKNTGIYTDSKKTEICEAMAGKSYDSLDLVFNTAYKVSLENELNTASDIDKIKILTLFEEVLAYDKSEYRIFLSSNDTFKSDAVSLLKGEYTPVKLYEAVDLIALKNTGNYTEVKPILTRMMQSTGIDLSNYFNLKDTFAVDNTLIGVDCKNGTELQEVVAKAISDTVRPSQGGGGGGGGGVSSGINFSKSEEIIYAPTSTVKDEEKKAAFSDLNGYDWAEPAIKVLATKGILNGKAEGQFAPGDLISREELVKMLVCIFEIHNNDAKSRFADLDEHWSDSYVASAEKYGLVNGISDDEFGKELAVTREDMAVLCFRFMNAFAIKLDTIETEDFADVKQISDYAVEAVKVMKGANVINGKPDGNFEPKVGCNRAEAAKVVYYIYTARNK